MLASQAVHGECDECGLRHGWCGHCGEAVALRHRGKTENAHRYGNHSCDRLWGEPIARAMFEVTDGGSYFEPSFETEKPEPVEMAELRLEFIDE